VVDNAAEAELKKLLAAEYSRKDFVAFAESVLVASQFLEPSGGTPMIVN